MKGLWDDKKHYPALQDLSLISLFPYLVQHQLDAWGGSPQLVIETLAFQSLTLMDTSFSPALFAFLQIWDNWTIASYTFILSQAPSQMKFQLVGIFGEGRALMIPDEHLLLCTICYSGQKSSADLMFKQLIIWACHKRTSGIIPSNLSWQKQVLDNMAQHSFKIQLDLKKCPLMWNWSLLWGDDSDGWLFSC